MKRILWPGALVWSAIAVFAVVNRRFEAKVLEPNLGSQVTELLGGTTLVAAVFLAAFLWFGTRSFSVRDALRVSTLWLLASSGLAFLNSTGLFFGTTRQLVGFLAMSAAAPWMVLLLVRRVTHSAQTGRSPG